jgi:hypothetical protein
MKSILYEFACGNLSTEPGFFEKNSHYGRTMDIISGTEDKLLSMLDEDQKEIFKQFVEAQAEINLLTANGKFVQGYRMGALMTMETFNYKDDVFTKNFF